MFLAATPALLAAASPTTAPSTQPAGRPRFRVGALQDKDLDESSGLIASRQFPGVFWTHDDSGGPPDLFAIDHDGKTLARFPIAAANRDWEDIAIDDHNRLYIADCGNNAHAQQMILIHRVAEPNPAAARPRQPLPIDRTWKLKYPAAPFDCEALFIHNGKGYLISKLLTFQPARLYRFDLGDPPSAQPATQPTTQPTDPDRSPPLEDLGPLPIRFPVTAADLSPDARRLAVLTVAGPYTFHINGDPTSALKSTPNHTRFLHPKLEAVTFVPEGLLATTEDRDVFLFRMEQEADRGEAKGERAKGQE